MRILRHGPVAHPRKSRALVVPPLVLLLLLCALVGPTESAARQTRHDVVGIVIDVDTRAGIGDVILRIVGTDVSAATDEEGRFVIRGVPSGDWVLRVEHLSYGSHEHAIAVSPDMAVELEVRLAQQAIELAPLVVEGETAVAREERTTGASFWEVTRPEIQRALGTSRHIGDLIRQTVPGIRMRQSNSLTGQDVCLEFRAAASISIVNQRPCAHPMVMLDGVRVTDPNFLYGSVGLSNLDRIQVIPPGSAGARYGTGSLYGVILIETARPGYPGSATPSLAPVDGSPRRLTFDWDQDPAGHDFGKTMAGAIVGNAIGLAAGVAIARQCIQIQREEIVSSCGGGGDFAAGAAAVLLPALGTALGARIGGGTDLSKGRLIPGLVGAGMMLFPGYSFAMSTAGGRSGVVNGIGYAFLIVGVPLAATLADRLFRSLR